MSATVAFLGTVLATAGASVVLLAAVGLHRFAEPLTRLHIASKASSTGILACLLGAGMAAGVTAVAVELALTGLFLLLTVPLATHALAAAHHARQRRILLSPAGSADKEPA